MYRMIHRAEYEQARANLTRDPDGCSEADRQAVQVWEAHAPDYRRDCGQEPVLVVNDDDVIVAGPHRKPEQPDTPNGPRFSLN